MVVTTEDECFELSIWIGLSHESVGEHPSLGELTGTGYINDNGSPQNNSRLHLYHVTIASSIAGMPQNWDNSVN